MTAWYRHGTRWLRVCHLSQHFTLDMLRVLGDNSYRHKPLSKESVSTCSLPVPSVWTLIRLSCEVQYRLVISFGSGVTAHLPPISTEAANVDFEELNAEVILLSALLARAELT